MFLPNLASYFEKCNIYVQHRGMINQPSKIEIKSKKIIVSLTKLNSNLSIFIH